ncbi:MAG TPA: serine/threonine-protein kinase, partial [Planctomycetota bacterium]|nr:serine/threonine-protein kinase [Planctomycetota bacterium]
MSTEIHTKDGLPPGTEMFGYEIERLLGRGGMGNVYLAKQKSLDRQVALKVLHPQRLRNPASVDSFLRKARAAAQLGHANLVAVHDVQADPERKLYCYSMEYVQGITASRLVLTQGVLKRPQALHLLYQIAKALGHAHRHGLVHRDVKPDNILVTQNGTAKLLDLGLVRDRFEQTAETGSRMLSLVGTPEYSAPEQHRNPKQAVPGSNVYSLGATLFFLLSEHPPFAGDTVIDLIVRVATKQLSYPNGIPTDCHRLLDLMLAKRPADRLYDGDAVVETLKGISEGRMPSLNPNGFNEGGTTDLGEGDEDFEDAETEGDISATELPPQPQPGESSRSSVRRPRIRRRR